MRCAALWIDPRGPYPRMPGVDCWDEARDARLYTGPWPVVAHPPCGPWGRLRHLCRNQSAEHGPLGVAAVRMFGGVLEHPAHSKLFEHEALPFPGNPPDEFGGHTIAVDQCDWGHVARKRTWLYIVAVTATMRFPAPGKPTHWVSGSRRRTVSTGGLVPPGIKICSAEQRRRTPPAFAEWLVGLAESCPML